MESLPKKTRWRFVRRILLVAAATTATPFLLTCAGCPVVGQGGRALFNPYTLEYRSQREYTLWYGTLPVYRSSPQLHENELVTYLVAEELVSPIHNQHERWEIVSHENTAWKDGYGRLYDVLIRNPQSIIEWSRADRRRAALYWTEAFTRLRSEWTVEQEIGGEIPKWGSRGGNLAGLQEDIRYVKSDVLIRRKVSLENGDVAEFPDELARVHRELLALRRPHPPETTSQYTLNDVLSAISMAFRWSW